MNTERLAQNSDKCCDTCGRYGAVEFDGRTLCPDCYQTAGSCCNESTGCGAADEEENNA